MGRGNVDTITRIDALLKCDVLPNTRADLVAFRLAAIAGTLDPDDDRYVCQLHDRLSPRAGASPIPPRRDHWPETTETQSISRNAIKTWDNGLAPSAAAEWLDGFFARLFILFGLTTRGAWRVTILLAFLASVAAGIAGFMTSQNDRILMGLGYWLAANIALGIALAILRWSAIAVIIVVRLTLVLLHWLLTGRDATVSRVHIDFD